MQTPSTEPEKAAPASNPPQGPRRSVWPVALGSILLGGLVGGGGVWVALHSIQAEPPKGAVVSLPPTAAPKAIYQCPMHPTITSDHPGDCPVCGMKLVLVTTPTDGQASAAGAAHGKRKIAFYRSPMDPKQTSAVPRKDAMGMDYVPVYVEEASARSDTEVKGRATITIDPARQQMIGLRTAPVVLGEVGGAFRTVGRLEVDPTLVKKTNVKVEGYVEHVYVNFAGQRVHKGEPLFSIYSPALLSAQQEYVLALQAGSTPGAGSAAQNAALLAATRRKLELWDIPARELERLEQTRTPDKTLTILSPIAGVVTAKNIVEGSHLNAGDAPYEITDLSMVWVMVDAYESDLARVHVGMNATLSLPAYPNRVFSGQVKFIDPLLDPNTRTVKVHLHFANPTGELKPELYGEVVLQNATRSGLRIPRDAVLHSGTQAVVFVALEQGKFRPVQVQLGQIAGDQVEVVSGLEEGQSVVTRANFLIDSESQLRASLADLTGR